jgi:hypothetical protein
MNVCPVCSVSFWATTRAIASLAPPAACGTMIVTGRVGYLSWAMALLPAPGGEGEQADGGVAAGELHGDVSVVFECAA